MPKTIQEMIDTVEELKKEALPHSDDLSEKVIQADRKQVLSHVAEILYHYTQEDRITRLEAYLANHWKQINGTQLAYTALPNSDVTRLLCDIACYVKAYKPQKLSDTPKGVLHYLMPTLNLDSCDDSYPDLYPCKENDYKDVDLDYILHTHILGEKGQYLIPIDYLHRVSLEADSMYLNNAYYDYQTHDETDVSLKEDEIRRLRHHSNLTEQLLLAKDEYELYTSESNSLYSHLRQLCNQLYFNSVDGVGQEEYAGNSAYVAIPQFFNYYEKLQPQVLKKVPKGVKKALEQIKHFGSDITTIGDIGSCLATRRQYLEQAMKGKEEILQGIAISGETKENLLKRAIEQLEQSKLALRQELETNQYRAGEDKLGISVKLLEALKINMSFNQLSDLDCLKKLTPDAIKDICQSRQYQTNIANTIAHLENMVVLATELSPAQLTALVQGLDDALYNKIVTQVKDFKPLTVIFDKERKNIFWQAYQSKLKVNIKTGEDYRRVSEVLNESQKERWYNSFSVEELMSVVNNTGDLFHVIASMSPEKRKLFYAEFMQQYGQDGFEYEDNVNFIYDQAFYQRTYEKIGIKLDSLPSDPEQAYYWLYSCYLNCFILHLSKLACDRYLFRPFDNLINEPILTALLPVIPAVILIAPLSWLLYEIVKTTWYLMTLQFSKLKVDLFLTALALTVSVVVTLITAAVTMFAALSLACRSIATIVNPITSRLPSCRFFKQQKTEMSKRETTVQVVEDRKEEPSEKEPVLPAESVELER